MSDTDELVPHPDAAMLVLDLARAKLAVYLERQSLNNRFPATRTAGRPLTGGVAVTDRDAIVAHTAVAVAEAVWQTELWDDLVAEFEGLARTIQVDRTHHEYQAQQSEEMGSRPPNPVRQLPGRPSDARGLVGAAFRRAAAAR